MNWYKKSNKALDDLFNEPPKKTVSVDAPVAKPVTLTLYRGFDVDMSKLKRSGNGYILSPERSEQGAMWFSRNKNEATGRGSHLLTYPLQCIRHIQTQHYDDGSTYDLTPQEIQDKAQPTENCRFWGGLELPDGWFFSYKTQKYIICTKPLVVTQDMISLDLPEESGDDIVASWDK